MQKRLPFIAIFLFMFILILAVPETTASAATCTWIGGTGNWNVAGNWSAACGGVPAANDDVVINSASATITQDVDTANLSSLTLSAGTLTTAANYTLNTGSLTISGGELSGTGEIKTVSSLVWSGGTISRNGTLTTANNATVTLSNDLVLQNTIVGSGNNLTINIPGAAAGSLSGDGTGTINLNGTLTKSGATTFNISGVVFTNTGTVAVSAGTLGISFPTNVTTTGVFTVASGSQLNLSGSQTFNASAAISGAGTVSFASGTLTVSHGSGYNITGETIVNSATVNLSASLVSLGTVLSQTGGSLNLGSHNVSLTTYTWDGGTLAGSGTVTVSSQVSLNASATLTGLTLAAGGSSAVGVGGGTGAESLSGTGTFNMQGALTKSGTNTYTISVVFKNNGSVSVTAGTLTIDLVPGDDGTGTYTVASGATLGFSAAGDFTFTAGASISGAGTVEFSAGNITISGTYTFSGTTTVASGATLIFNSNQTLSGTISGAGTVEFTAGTITFNSSATIANIVWSGGTLSGSGSLESTTSLTMSGSLSLNTTLTVSGTASISTDGTLGGSGGIFNLNSSGTLTKSGTGTSFTISSITFNNKGTVDLTGGNLSLLLPAGSSNHGTYSISHGAHLYLTGAASPSTSSITTIGGDGSGAGTVEFVSGDFAVTTSYDLSGSAGTGGSTLVDSGASVDLGGANPLKPGDTLAITDGTLDIGNKDVVVNNLTWSNGTLSGTGGSSLTVTVSLTLTGNLSLNTVNLNLNSGINLTLDGAGSMTGIGSFTMDGTLDKINAGTFDLSGIVFENQGTVKVDDGKLKLKLAENTSGSPDESTYNVAAQTASLDLTVNNAGDHFFGTSSVIIGPGVITFISGTVTINSDYERSGETILNGAGVDVNVNYPTITPTPSSTGKFTVTQGSLVFAGSHTFDTGADITGGGSVEFHSGTITVNSSYNLSGAGSQTIVSGADAIFSAISGVSLGSSLTVSGGTLALGANSPGLANLTWSGGTISGTGSISVSTAATLSGTLSLNGNILAAPGSSTVGISGTGSLTGTGTFNMGGSLTKSGAGDFTINLSTFNNTGAVNVTGGSLKIALPDGTSSSGSYSVGGGAGLNLSGNHTFAGSANFSGAGTAAFTSGSMAFQSNYNISGTTTVSGASADFSNAAYLSPGANLVLSAGSINFGYYSVSVNQFTWSGGTLSGVYGFGMTTVNTNLDLSGTLTLTGATLVNAGSAAGSISSDGSMSGSGSFTQAGTLTKTGAGTNFTFSGIAFSNSGTINVNEGTLMLGQLSSATSDGPYTVAADGTLVIGGPYTFSSLSSIDNDGTINFDAGASNTINFNGTFNPTATAGTINVSSGTTNFNSSANLVNLGDQLSITGGIINLSSGETPSVATLSLTGGGLTGSDNLSANIFNWSGGLMSGGATTTVPASGQLNFTAGSLLNMDARVLINQGTAVWNRDGSDSELSLTNNASFTNDSGGTFEVQAGGSSIFSGSGTFNNLGLFTKSNTGTSGFDGVSFINGGTVNVADGILVIGVFSPSAPASSGSYSIANNATLRFDGNATYQLDSGSQITGNGSVDFYGGTIDINGSYNINGETQVSGADATFEASSQPTSLGSTLAISGGTLNLISGSGVTVSGFNLSGGVLTGSDSLTVGTLDWTDGDMTGSGPTVVNTTLTHLSTSTTPNILNQRILTINGSATFSGTNWISPQNNAVINIANGATLEVDGGPGYAIYGTGTLENHGTLNLISGMIYVTEFDQFSGGITNESISNATAGDGYAQIQVNQVNLAGDLNIDFGSYHPSANLTFTLIYYNEFPASQFSQFSVVGNLNWQPSYNPNSLDLTNPDAVYNLFLPYIKH